MKWIFWFIVVNFISVIAGFQSLFADTSTGFIIAIIAWSLFIWAYSRDQKRKQEDLNRKRMLDEYLRRNLQK